MGGTRPAFPGWGAPAPHPPGTLAPCPLESPKIGFDFMGSTIRLAVIGGDGIGPEVTAEALKVLAGGDAGRHLRHDRL